ncbi:MAG TPA: hypothetical protein VLV15_07250, partial [Dongiaceae bacterium]|nr:hypothetical protein [Dongiaceae bacterium]
STHAFKWTRADSTLRAGYPVLDQYGGPLTLSPVECFAVTASGDSLVTIDSLRVRSSYGVPVTLSTAVALVNRGAP